MPNDHPCRSASLGSRSFRVGLSGFVLVPLVALGLVLTGPAGVASAATGVAPPPVSVGEVIKSTPATTIVKSASRLNPWVRAASIGMALWQVGSSFLPLPDGAEPNDDSLAGDPVTSAVGCMTSIAAVRLVGTGVEGSIYWSGCSGGGNTGGWVTYRNGRCRIPGGNPPFTNTGTQKVGLGGAATTGSVNFNLTNLCPAGTTLEGIELQGHVSSSPSMGETGFQIYGIPFPATDYTQKTTVDCRQPSGTVVSFTQTLEGHPDKILVPSCEELAPGSLPWGLRATGGGTGGPQTSLLDVIIDRNILTQYPDCFTNGALTCTVAVYVGGVRCTFGMVGCGYWWNDLQTDPSADIKCKWGPYTVSIGQCEPLRDKYRKRNPGTVTGTNPDGSPEISYPPHPDDPPEPTPTPTPTPTGPANPSPMPTEGPNPSDPPTVPDPSTDPDSQSCWGQGWSWNPVSWVYVPVKCAMIWAFVPTNAPSFADVASPLPPGWLPSFPDLGSNGCGAITMPPLTLGYKDWGVGATQLVDTCDDPWPLIRTFTYNGMLLLVLVGAMWTGFRAVTSGIGMGVASGGGGSDD